VRAEFPVPALLAAAQEAAEIVVGACGAPRFPRTPAWVGRTSVDVSAVAYFRVVDAVKSVVAIDNANAAISQIAQTTLHKVVGQHTLDETLSETDRINVDIREILDVTTTEWGVEVTLVELKDIQLPDSMKRAMAQQAEAEREKRAKIINAEGEISGGRCTG
jgi:regulator of protease activity HflC (stomatin/prohibitin superfamily)